MSLLRILESMHANLKAVVAAGVAALALLMAADAVLRLTHKPAAERGETAPAAEHGVAAAEHAATAVPEEHAEGTAAAESSFWPRAYHVAETMPVFWTAFGVLGCVILVIVSKAALGPIVHRGEGYDGE